MLWKYRGLFVPIGIAAVIAAWSRWDRRDMKPAEPVSGCMSIEQLKETDAFTAYVAQRVGRVIEQRPEYAVDDHGCAYWAVPQLSTR